jgi:uncharacterized protein with von Willebrand factor type A (vWA) domain
LKHPLPADLFADRGARVTRNLLWLPRLLRREGVHVDAGRARLFLSALAELDLEREDDVRTAARATLVTQHADIAPFEETFDLFWAMLRDARPPGTALPLRAGRRMEVRPEVPLESPAGDLAPFVRREMRVRASPIEHLRGIDFASLSGDERAAVARFLERLEWSPGRRRTRRFRSARQGPRIDARATMRRSLRTHGEPLDLMRKARREQRRALVILCDISGSMEAYTRLLLSMSHALARGWGRVETFTFGTRLTRITRQLRERRADAALARVSRAVSDWSGGTRIGEALRSFNLRWSRRVLGRGAIVLLLTDGWERGDPHRLGLEAARLQRASYRLVWLDPISGTPGYTPSSSGARELIAHVDDHLAADTIDRLLAIATLLGNAEHGRPVRRAASFDRAVARN